MTIIEWVVSQHAEEAAFLWLLRDAAVSAPHYSLADLAELDRRVERHIKGLRVAGDEGWPWCVEGLQQEESGEVFAAAMTAFDGEDPRRIEQVCAAVESAPETARGFTSALGWTARDKLGGKVAGLLESNSPLWRRVGIAACAVHRADCGEYLSRALEDADPMLRARALRAAGETARWDLLPALRGQIRSQDPTCGFWAAWSAVLLGDRSAVGVAIHRCVGHTARLTRTPGGTARPVPGRRRQLAAGVGALPRAPEGAYHRLWCQRRGPGAGCT